MLASVTVGRHVAHVTGPAPLLETAVQTAALGSSGRFHNLRGCPSEEYHMLFTYISIYMCVSWVSPDCSEAQSCKTSSECASYFVFADSDGAMECTSLPMPDRRETEGLKTKTISNPSGSSQSMCRVLGQHPGVKMPGEG